MANSTTKNGRRRCAPAKPFTVLDVLMNNYRRWLTNVTVAEHLGVAEGTIRNYRSGRYDLSVAEARSLARMFDEAVPPSKERNEPPFDPALFLKEDPTEVLVWVAENRKGVFGLQPGLVGV